MSSYFCSRGHFINHVASSYVKLIFVRYFDDMNVMIPLVVLCERRIHNTSPKGMHCAVVIIGWVARVTET